jgi:(1->4)-alpha-D-glucan 1-alpha-D-glucosylmutase
VQSTAITAVMWMKEMMMLDPMPAILEAVVNQQEALRRSLYVVVEKILGVHEALRQDWPVYGTSGYDFLNVLNALFVDAEKRGAFTRLYRDWTKDPRAFAEVGYDAKRLIMQVSLASEVHMLAYQLDRLAQQHRRSRDFTFNRLR